MALMSDVKGVCDRLAPLGWRDLLLAITNDSLDIAQPTSAKLRDALTQAIPSIDRTKAGFDDFHPAASKAITAGNPSQSLLYHALASPQVHPTADGAPASNPDRYPTLEDLDIIENYIFSLLAERTDLDGTIVAVFAYQYRTASRTTHLRHADLAYSRTGVARVGTAPPHYDRARRSFWVIPQNRSEAVSVLPARYGVFLARRAKPGTAGSIQGGHSGATDQTFVFPVHKLFAGKECLKGRDLSVEFLEFHRNEKLRKTHRLSEPEGGLPLPPGFDISKAPFVRDSSNGGNLASRKPIGSTVLIVPTPGSTLVRTVKQRNSVSNANRIVHFNVPEEFEIDRHLGEEPRSTRYATSTLEIPSFGLDRLSPEYVNIRHKVDPDGSADQIPEDLNELSEAAFTKAMEGGGYAAAHFTDDSCDGCVEAVVGGLASDVENLPAFSLITAPDFYPLANQLEMEIDPTIREVEPLSKGRLAVNPSLPRPSDPNAFAFKRQDKTVTAVVGGIASGPVSILRQPNRMVSFLPDAASNVFAPGWDTSRSRDAQGVFLTSSGLGSPFPEDAKLCAALASFWPAVAPDNGRTFGNEDPFGNQLPMLDEELGFHPGHERVKSGELSSYRGWDGEFGPFFEKVGSKLHVNYVAIERADYVSNALAGRIRVSLTAEVQSDELIARNQAFEKCEDVLDVPEDRAFCLVVVRKIDDWATFGAGSPELTGGGFLMEFAEMKATRKPTNERHRVRREVKKRHVCQVGQNGIAYKNGNAAFAFKP